MLLRGRTAVSSTQLVPFLRAAVASGNPLIKTPPAVLGASSGGLNFHTSLSFSNWLHQMSGRGVGGGSDGGSSSARGGGGRTPGAAVVLATGAAATPGGGGGGGLHYYSSAGIFTNTTAQVGRTSPCGSPCSLQHIGGAGIGRRGPLFSTGSSSSSVGGGSGGGTPPGVGGPGQNSNSNGALHPGLTASNMVATVRHTIRDTLNELLAGPDTATLLAESKTKALCQFYSKLIPDDKKTFLQLLSTDYGVDQPLIFQLTKNLHTSQDRVPATVLRLEDRLRQALIPRYQHLFTQISRLENGVKFLVDLRTDVLALLASRYAEQDAAYLQSMNQCLRELLSLWFSVGFLQLERITWESPCDMLQKISEYEAVHPIRNWADIKRRVGPYRRCFVYTHASMPREPVVVLHTALTKDISSSIQSIVERTRAAYETNQEIDATNLVENPSNITTAIFYSITSTQKGLQGVELGNYIIKNAVREVLSEFPHVYQFSSLSPIPGFKDWLLMEITKQLQRQEIGEAQDSDASLLTPEERTEITSLLGCPPKKSMLTMLKKTLQTNTWVQDEQLCASLQQPLLRLCARYLYLEKRRGYALNPVANFHLRNGAMLWRINWLADTTPRGVAAACGIMVNYRYFLERTEENSRQYMDHKEIPASEQILQLVQTFPRINSPDNSSNSSM